MIVNKTLIFFIGITISYAALPFTQNIFVSTDGDIFQYKGDKLDKVEAKVETIESRIFLSKKQLVSNELASVFQALKLPGCRDIQNDSSADFSPYNSNEHFLRYFETLIFKNGLIVIVRKSSSKPKTVAIYAQKNGFVCSTGVSSNSVFLDQLSKQLYFTLCDNNRCQIFRIKGQNNSAQPENIMEVQGEVMDIGYDEKTNHLIILVRKYTHQDGLLGKLFAKVGHGREKYDLFLHALNLESNKKTKALIAKDIVNPTLWLNQLWYVHPKIMRILNEH